MEKNKNCSACNIKLVINNYKKDKSVCRDCYNEKKGKNILVPNEITTSHQQSKIENGNNNRTLLVGPSSSGKTYLMSKNLSLISDRDVYTITKSPPEQYTNSNIKIKEINDEIKPLNEYENGIIVFDDILGSSNSRFIDQFFIRGRHNNLDIYSQSYFDLPKRTIRNNSNKIVLFNQTLKDIEQIYRHVAGYDMNYDEFKELCRKSWEEDYNYLYIDRSKKRDRGKYCICNESKNTYLEATPQTKPFQIFQMLYSNKDREDLKNLEELVSLQDQVKVVRLQDKIGKQNFHEDMKKVFEPVTNTIKDVSENITKTLTENSNNNNKAIENLKEKILELMNDSGLIAPYLASSLVNVFKPENKSQFRLKKDLNSTKMNDFLINEGIPVTLVSNKLIFRDSNKSFELDGDLLETMTNYDFNVDHSNQQDRKLIYEFAKQMNFNIRQKRKKSDRDKSIVRLLWSPAIMASGVSKTIFLSSDPNEICDRLKLLLQEKHAGNNSDIINEEIFAIIDKLLEYKCIPQKQHKQILIKCNLL